METVSVSKFTLNPLATCFIPSNMKHQSVLSAVFSVPSCETSVNEYTEAENVQFSITTDEQNIGYLKVIKAQSNSIQAKILRDSFVTKEVKETHSHTVKNDVVVKEPLITEQILSTMNEVSGKETPVKSDDYEETSERNSKDSKDTETFDSKDVETIGSKIGSNMILTKLDSSLPNQTTVSKIFKLLKGRTKTLKMLLPFAVRSMLVMEFFYRIGLRTISLDVTMTSNMSSAFKPKSNRISFPNKAKKAKTAKKRKSYESHCPPMFGWIIPFQAFGNPLRLSATGGKDYVHTSCVDDLKLHQSEHSESSELSVNDHEITLEQCSLELKAVIKDVCDSISFHDEDHNSVSKTRKRPVWETKTTKEIGKHSTLDIIDDGIHPLLQDFPEVDTEDAEIPKIQAILEQAFSLHNSSGEEILSSQSVCNPPCSVWCNKVPPPAKDAYKRFIRNMDSESTACNKVTDVKVLKRSLYKRCFSADDTPKTYHDKMPFQSSSSFESKERLLLLRNDPVSFIKQSRTPALKDISHKSKSIFVSDQSATKDSTESSDKWSLYDGADSKWQPLPDCIPSTDSAQKHVHKKTRDIRRQKSVC